MYIPESVKGVQELLDKTKYVSDKNLASILFVSLKLGRPLILEGPGGVGKSYLAVAVAQALGRPLIRLQCYAGLDISSAIYEWNYAAQILQIRVAENSQKSKHMLGLNDLFSEQFLIKRPLLRALEATDQGDSPVLLLDQIDHADSAFDSYLLEMLSDFQVSIPDYGTIKAESRPIIFLTSGRTRPVDIGLKRRCFYHWMDYPNENMEKKIIDIHEPEAGQKLTKSLKEMIVSSCDSKKNNVYKWHKILEEFNSRECNNNRSDYFVGVSNNLGPPKDLIPFNIMHFARRLRDSGLPVGPDKVLDAINIIEFVGLQSREDFYWSMHSIFVSQEQQSDIFDQVFRIFWVSSFERNSSAKPLLDIDDKQQISRRVSDALALNDSNSARDKEKSLEATMYSNMELLQDMDFDSMSLEEIEEAKLVIAEMRLPISELPVRRFSSDPIGKKIDMRGTLRSGAHASSGFMPLKYKSRNLRNPPLVILCDISGSMSRYSRLFLHFVHAITTDRDRVHTFIFGTRLTNISRQLRNRDVDIALDQVSSAAFDWSGGTRIGDSLGNFNRFWSRRVLSQGAVVLLITDGLDRGNINSLEFQMMRLQRSCRTLIWLNPLLRYDGFRPEARGVKAIMPYVSQFRAVHSLNRLRDIGEALSNLNQ